MDSETKCNLIITFSVLGGVGLLLLIIFVSISFDYISDHEYGLWYNTWEQTLNPEVYTRGRYFTGVNAHFKYFPANLTYIEYSSNAATAHGQPMSVWTSSGLNAFLELKIYYYLDVANSSLLDFYYEFGPDWKLALRNFAYSAIMDACIDYNSTNFISHRHELEPDFIKNVQRVFDDKTKKLVRVKSLHLLNYEFVPEFETAITQKLLESVNTKIFELQKNASVINETIKQNQILTDARIYLNQADVQSYQKQQLMQAQGEAIKTLITTDADSYKSIDDQFGFSLDNSLLNFILAVEQSNFQASKKIGFSNAEINIK